MSKTFDKAKPEFWKALAGSAWGETSPFEESVDSQDQFWALEQAYQDGCSTGNTIVLGYYFRKYLRMYERIPYQDRLLANTQKTDPQFWKDVARHEWKTGILFSITVDTQEEYNALVEAYSTARWPWKAAVLNMYRQLYNEKYEPDTDGQAG